MDRLLPAVLASAMLAMLSPVATATDCPEPQIYGEGVFSRPGYEWRLTFSPDRRLALWSTSDTFFPVTGEAPKIVYSRYRNGAWSAPQVVPFSGFYADVDPAFSPDGKTLYFSSRRPTSNSSGIRPDFDLWSVAHRRDGSWGTPRHLGQVNSSSDELYASIDRNGRLYFGSNRDAAQWDVWRSTRQRNGGFGAASKLGTGVNTPTFWEFNPEISPSGKVLLFTALSQPGDYGWGDLHASVVVGNYQSPAVNLGECINTSQDDYHPTALWDQGRLIWIHASVDDASVPANFYSLSISELIEALED